MNWYKNDEKNSKLFLNLENSKSAKRQFAGLGLCPEKAHFQLAKHFKRIGEVLQISLRYDGLKRFRRNVLLLFSIPVLTENLKLLCEGSLSNAECLNALKDCPYGKF